MNHIFYGEIKNRTAKGFHSTALASTIYQAAAPVVEQVLWQNPNGVYKAWVNVADTRTRRFRRKKSTMFPDSWTESRGSAILYLAWLKNRGKQKGTLNLGITKIQYLVKDKVWLQGFPTR